jgi:hypothetical protein
MACGHPVWSGNEQRGDRSRKTPQRRVWATISVDRLLRARNGAASQQAIPADLPQRMAVLRVVGREAPRAPPRVPPLLQGRELG